MSGLCAAAALVRGGWPHGITILEKAAKPGKKILVSGNGRCNLTNSRIEGRKGAEFYNDPLFLRGVLETYGYKYIRSFYNSLGLLLSDPDADGRVYPASFSAAAVVRILKNAVAGRAEIITGADAVLSESGAAGQGYNIITADGRAFLGGSVIYSAGGCAAGNESPCYKLLDGLASVSPPRPSLCPLPCEKADLYGLENTRVKARVAGLGRTEDGEVQFRKDSLSGIVIFNFAAVLQRAGKAGGVLSLDLFPKLTGGALTEFIAGLSGINTDALGALSGLVPDGAARNVLKRLKIDPQMPASGICGDIPGQIAGLLKNLTFRVKMQPSFCEAQCVAGGVPTDEVDSGTFGVKKHPGFYIAGEALDIDGECGGFNLHFAAASGISAANAILLKREIW